MLQHVVHIVVDYFQALALANNQLPRISHLEVGACNYPAVMMLAAGYDRHVIGNVTPAVVEVAHIQGVH